MNYATTYHGYGTPAPRAKAKATAPTVKRVRKLDAKDKGCKRNTERQTKVRTDSYATNGFLRTSFLPRLKETETVQAYRETPEMERDFYQSLSQLAEHYGIEPKPTQSFGYPHNISIALSDLKEQLQNKVEDWQEIRLVHHEGSTFFAKEERYDTGTMLYYIPVIPLYLMLKDPKRRHTAHLLLSACSYLYHIADVPYYRQQNCYLSWVYDMVLEWGLEVEEDEPNLEFFSEYRQSEYIGDIMEKKIYNLNNLSRFNGRLINFKSKDKFDNECLQFAWKVFELYKEYPNSPIHQKIRSVRHEEDDDQECKVTLDKYVSFFASSNGVLSDWIIEMVNHDIQEYGAIDEPIIYKPFDGREIEDNNFDFEKRLFPLIEELTILLNDY